MEALLEEPDRLPSKPLSTTHVGKEIRQEESGLHLPRNAALDKLRGCTLAGRHRLGVPSIVEAVVPE